MSNILDSYIPKFLVDLKKNNEDIITVTTQYSSPDGDVYELDTRTLSPNLIQTTQSLQELQPEISTVYPFKIVMPLDFDGSTILQSPSMTTEPTASQGYYAPIYFERYNPDVIRNIDTQFTELTTGQVYNMPNQANFRSDVTTPTEPRFSASRIVTNPSELILFEEVPASFAFDAQDNVEIHFYTTGNQLLLSTTTVITDEIIKSHIVSYADNSYKTYIRIDFTKLFKDKNLILVPGDYRMVLNFFSDEIGSYTDRRLTIDTIAPSRTEVQLTFNNVIDDVTRREDAYLLREFVEPAFNKTDAVGVAQKIFKSGVELNDSTEGVTVDNVVANIEIPEINQTYANTIAKIDKLNLRESFDLQVNDFLLQLCSFIQEEIVINGDDRIQQDQYEQIIRTITTDKIEQLRQVMDMRITVS